MCIPVISSAATLRKLEPTLPGLKSTAVHVTLEVIRPHQNARVSGIGMQLIKQTSVFTENYGANARNRTAVVHVSTDASDNCFRAIS